MYCPSVSRTKGLNGGNILLRTYEKVSRPVKNLVKVIVGEIKDKETQIKQDESNSIKGKKAFLGIAERTDV